MGIEAISTKFTWTVRTGTQAILIKTGTELNMRIFLEVCPVTPIHPKTDVGAQF